MKPNILYLRTDLGSEKIIAGGSVSHTTGVINGFKKLGFTVIACSGAIPHIIKQLGIECTVLKNPALFKSLGFKINCLVSNIFFTVRTYSKIKKESLQFVYQRYSMLNSTGVLIAKLKKVPLILEFNSSAIWADKNWTPQRKLKFGFLVSWFEKYNLRNAKLIVVVSQPLKEYLITQKVDPKKIVVNPNGVDPSIFDPQRLQNNRVTIRKKLSIENKFVFGFVGTFSPWHGINILSDIIPQILKKKKQAHFLLIGDGQLLPYLKKELKKQKMLDSVTFQGIIPHKEAKKYLAACDAFLVPSQNNSDGTPFFGSPTKLFEYLSLAKPIIGSRVAQVEKVINPYFDYSKNNILKDQCGYLVEPTNIKGFITCACNVMDLTDSQRKKLGSNAREKVIKNYTWHLHVKKIVTALEAIKT